MFDKNGESLSKGDIVLLWKTQEYIGEIKVIDVPYPYPPIFVKLLNAEAAYWSKPEELIKITKEEAIIRLLET